MINKHGGNPTVSVVMSVYNGERYLASSIQSVLDQAYTDFEFIIVNDGSQDNTQNILNEYAKKDKRIIIFHEKENVKLVRAINKGCREAKGKYIARMDADDLCKPQRFTKQVRYLNNHPEVGVLGSWVEDINAEGKRLGDWKVPSEPFLVAWFLQFDCVVAQPSVMMRRSVLEDLDYYRVEALQCEDYDLWCRASFITQVANLPESLLKRRVWSDSRCFVYSDDVEAYHLKFMRETIEKTLSTQVDLNVVKMLRQTSLQQECSKDQAVLQAGIKIIQRLTSIHGQRWSNPGKALVTVRNRDTGGRIYYLFKCLKKIKAVQPMMQAYISALLHNPKGTINSSIKGIITKF
jgi:glycosyltransferase involved in cell wall biosynthesis